MCIKKVTKENGTFAEAVDMLSMKVNLNSDLF